MLQYCMMERKETSIVVAFAAFTLDPVSFAATAPSVSTLTIVLYSIWSPTPQNRIMPRNSFLNSPAKRKTEKPSRLRSADKRRQ